MQSSNQEKLNAFLSKGGAIFAAEIFVSNQRLVRHTLKEKWTNIVPILEVKIGKLIQHHNTPDDILTRKGPLDYFLISMNKDAVEAHSHVERLASSVYEEIFAEDPFLEGLQISISAHHITTEKLADMSALKELLFGTENSDGWSATISKKNYSSFRPERVQHKLLRHIIGLQSVCETLLSEIHPLPDAADNLTAHHGRLARLSEASNIVNTNIASLLDRQADAPVSKAPEPVDPEPIPEPKTQAPPKSGLEKDLHRIIGDDASLVYFPIWDVEQQLVNSYRAAIIRQIPTGPVELNTGTETSIAAYKIDQLVMRKVIEDITDFAGEEDGFTFVMPLHINTIQSKEHFSKVELGLKSLSIVERRALKVEIVGATEYTTAATILALINKIKVYCSGVGFRKPNGLEVSPQFRKMGITHTGFHIEDIALENINVGQEIEKLGYTAEKANLVSFIYGIDTVADSAQAIGAGIKFLGGEAIGSPLETPWGTLPFAVESLYSRVLAN